MLLFAVFFLLEAIASYAPINNYDKIYLWAFIMVMTKYFWFIGYALMDKRPITKKGLVKQFGIFQPFWGSTNVPFPKGAAYLDKIEAKNSHDLAVTQLNGVTLLLWACVLYVFFLSLAWIYLRFHLPSLSYVLNTIANGNHVSTQTAWIAVATNFTFSMLSLPIKGHIIVATIRMAGFNAMRNTNNPLQAVSIADFWNRYYFYYKELLVEFFYFPTYFRCFKKHPRIRAFIATLAAACFGNALYHFMKYVEYPMKLGLFKAFEHFYVFIVYGLILATAIGISQLRQANIKTPKHWLKRRFVAPLFTVSFYCLISIFAQTYETSHIWINFTLLFNLFGINTT
ncbi:MAG: hypothetical protein P1U63_04110 [Coxiellaceae bacterium]|nr:hypothetical protein [Coxiellaceae bacterium]